MPQERLTPVNEYHLSAEGTQIVFCSGDEDTMTLAYNGTVFRGRSLYRETTLMGIVVSVQLEVISDLHTIFLSVAVPEGNRPSDARSIAVSTFAVISTERTSIAGPQLVGGQIRRYEVIPLQGNAW